MLFALATRIRFVSFDLLEIGILLQKHQVQIKKDLGMFSRGILVMGTRYLTLMQLLVFGFIFVLNLFFMLSIRLWQVLR